MVEVKPIVCGSKTLKVVENTTDKVICVCKICNKSVIIIKNKYSKKELKKWLGVN